MALSEAEELELLELEEAEYQSSTAQQPQGMPGQGGSKIGELIDPVMRGLDYAGGIARTGLAQGAEAVTGRDIVQEGDWGKTLKGEAPGSAEYMENAGVPEGARVDLNPFMEGDSSVRDVGGFALDVASDPLTYTGLGLISKVGKGAAKGVVSKAAKSIAKGGSETAGGVFSKTAEALTAAPKRSIEVYSQRTDELNKLFKKYADDTAEYADDVKAKINTTIQDTRVNLNKSIENALDEMPDLPAVDVSWVKNDLSSFKGRLNKTLDKDAISEIDEFSGLIDEMSVDGYINVKDLNKLKQYMQEQAKGAYRKQGQIFTRSKSSQKAAKQIAQKVRKQLNQISPEIAKANNSLSRLHTLEQSMNKNIIKEGGSYNALKTAGSGANKRNRKHLKEISDITGTDLLRDAENVSAFDTFAKPSLLPMDTTGKSVARTGAAYILGGIPGAVMTSPMTLKVAINAGKIPKNVVKFFGGPGAKAADAEKIYKIMNTPQGKSMLGKIGKAARIAAVHSQHGGSKALTRSGNSSEESMVAKLKGKDKWAFDGYLNVLSESGASLPDNEKFLNKIFKNPRGKKLLISAASAKPGSKRMEKILKDLSSIKGGGK